MTQETIVFSNRHIITLTNKYRGYMCGMMDCYDNDKALYLKDLEEVSAVFSVYDIIAENTAEDEFQDFTAILYHSENDKYYSFQFQRSCSYQFYDPRVDNYTGIHEVAELKEVVYAIVPTWKWVKV